MIPEPPDELQRILDRLYLMGRARNRAVDPEIRTITISDDEALIIVAAIVTTSVD